MVGNIRIIHISPETNGAGEILPHSFVFPDALFTFLDERLNTVLLDLLFSVETKKLLNLKLYRKSVGIPAGFTRNHVSFHGAVSRDHVFDDTGKYVSDMRLAVCGRRSVIEHVWGSFSAAVDTFFKDFFVFPEFLNLFFPVHKVQVC